MHLCCLTIEIKCIAKSKGKYGFGLGCFHPNSISIYLFCVFYLLNWAKNHHIMVAGPYSSIHTDPYTLSQLQCPDPGHCLICLHRHVPVILRISVSGENKSPVDNCSVPMSGLWQSALLLFRKILLQNCRETQEKPIWAEARRGNRLLPPTHTLTLLQLSSDSLIIDMSYLIF